MSITFAIDSSGKTAGVCVLKDNTLIFEKTLYEGLTHSETLLSLVEEAFTSTSLEPCDVTCYAITTGPGSFTGLRIGLALVKGLALPYNTKVVPVSTLEALAVSCKHTGIIIPALDARRGEVYWAAFETKNGFERIVQDSAGPVSDIELTVAMENNDIIFIGDGAELCYTLYNVKPYTLSPTVPCSIAYGAAIVAANNTSFSQAKSITPSYLRLSQAERERMERMASKQN